MSRQRNNNNLIDGEDSYDPNEDDSQDGEVEDSLDTETFDENKINSNKFVI